jgi:hypothetical protein
MKVKELKALAARALVRSRRSKDPTSARAWSKLGVASLAVVASKELLDQCRINREASLMTKERALAILEEGDPTAEQLREGKARVREARRALRQTPKE